MSGAAKTSLPVSLLIGALVVPLSAIASVAIANLVGSSAAGSSPVPAPTSIAIDAPVAPSLSEDLAVACGPAGEELAASDRDGTATQIQKAALDALRPLCEALGVPIPGVGDDIGATSIQSATAVPVSNLQSSSPPDIDRGDEDDEHEDDEHEDDEWEEDD